MKPLLLLIAFCAAANAATNRVSFRLLNSDSSPAAHKQVRIKPSPGSFPRVEGSGIAGLDYGFKLTDANGELTNAMVTGTYDITFTNRFLPTTFQITVPATNFAGVLTAAELTTAGTNLPANTSAFSQSAADARFFSLTGGTNIHVFTNNGRRGFAITNLPSGGGEVTMAELNALSNRTWQADHTISNTLGILGLDIDNAGEQIITQGSQIAGLSNIVAGFSDALPPSQPTWLVVYGDSNSTSNSVGAATSWPKIFTNQFASNAFFTLKTNGSVGGYTVANAISDFAGGRSAFTPGAGTNVLCFFPIGLNDIVTYTNTATSTFSNLCVLWNMANTNGFRVVAYTVPFSRLRYTEVFLEERRKLNTLIRSNPKLYFKLVDWAASLPPPPNTNYYTDVHHLNSNGVYQLAASTWQTLQGRPATTTTPADELSGFSRESGGTIVSANGITLDFGAPLLVRNTTANSAASITVNSDAKAWSWLASGSAFGFGFNGGIGLYDNAGMFPVKIQSTGEAAWSRALTGERGFVMPMSNAAPPGLTATGGHLWSDGTNMWVVLQNAAGTRATNKLTLGAAWP